MILVQFHSLNFCDVSRKIGERYSRGNDHYAISGRRITFPIVLNDKWNKDALQRYMSTTRDRAVYLPSNVEYLAKNNGLSDSNEALQKLVQSDWVRVLYDFAIYRR